MTDLQKPLYVRLPADAAERLDRAAFETGTPKKDLVADLVTRYLEPRRVTVTLPNEGATVGRHAFHPVEPPEVLDVAQAAELLQVDEAAVAELAERGELPGRRVGGEWRFARAALLGWLGAGA